VWRESTKVGYMSTRLPKIMSHTPNFFYHNKHVTNKRGNKSGKLEVLQVQRVGIVGKTRGGRGGKHEAKVAN
jgi:hypothetical protein